MQLWWQWKLCVGQELENCKNDFLDLQRRISTLKQGPFGLRHAGEAKARRKLVQTILQPQSVATTQANNKAYGRRGRLYGDKSSQLKIIVTLAKVLLSRDDLMEQPLIGFAPTRISNYVFEKNSHELGSYAILASWDQGGVSHEGYGHIYKTMKGHISLVNKT